MNMTNAYNTSVATYSFYAIKKIESVTQDYLATGGMFMASIPVLTLFLLTGSVYALTSLTGRMAGADVINEKIASPDIMTPNALVQQQAMSTALNGVHTQNGVDNWRLTTASGAGQEYSVALNNANQASSTFMAQVGKAFSNGFNHTSSAALTEALNNSYSATSKETQSAIHNLGKSLLSGTGLENNAMITNAVGIQASLGGSLGTSFFDVLSASAGVNIDASARAQISENLKSSESMDLKQEIGNNQSMQRDLSNALASQISNNRGVADALSNSATESGALQESASRVVSAQESLSETQKNMTSNGATREWTANNISMAFRSDPNLKKQIHDYWNGNFDNDMYKQQLNAQINQMKNVNSLSGGALYQAEDIETLAKMKVMSEGSNDRNAEARLYMGAMLAGNSPDGQDSYNTDRARHLEHPNNSIGEQNLKEYGNVVNDNFAKNKELTEIGHSELRQKVDNADKKVREENEQNKEKVEDRARKNKWQQFENDNGENVKASLKSVSNAAIQNGGSLLGKVSGINQDLVDKYRKLVRDDVFRKRTLGREDLSDSECARNLGELYATEALGDRKHYEQDSEAYDKAHAYIASTVAYKLYRENLFADSSSQGQYGFLSSSLFNGNTEQTKKEEQAWAQIKESYERKDREFHDFAVNSGGLSEAEFKGWKEAVNAKINTGSPHTDGVVNNDEVARETINYMDYHLYKNKH